MDAAIGLLIYGRASYVLKDKIVSDLVFTYRKERGCSSANIINRAMREDANQFNKELYLMFVDFAKYFDSVNQYAISLAAQHLRAPETFTNFLIEDMTHNKFNLLTDIGISELTEHQTGLRQGNAIACVVVLILGHMLAKLMQSSAGSYQMTGQQETLQIPCIIYSDDTTVTATSKQSHAYKWRDIGRYSIATQMGISQYPKSFYMCSEATIDHEEELNIVAWIRDLRQPGNIIIKKATGNEKVASLGISFSADLDDNKHQENKIRTKIRILERKMYAKQLSVPELKLFRNLAVISLAGFDPLSSRLSPAFAKSLDHESQQRLSKACGMTTNDRWAPLFVDTDHGGLGIRSFIGEILAGKARETMISMNSTAPEGIALRIRWEAALLDIPAEHPNMIRLTCAHLASTGIMVRKLGQYEHAPRMLDHLMAIWEQTTSTPHQREIRRLQQNMFCRNQELNEKSARR